MIRRVFLSFPRYSCQVHLPKPRGSSPHRWYFNAAFPLLICAVPPYWRMVFVKRFSCLLKANEDRTWLGFHHCLILSLNCRSALTLGQYKFVSDIPKTSKSRVVIHFLRLSSTGSSCFPVNPLKFWKPILSHPSFLVARTSPNILSRPTCLRSRQLATSPFLDCSPPSVPLVARWSVEAWVNLAHARTRRGGFGLVTTVRFACWATFRHLHGLSAAFNCALRGNRVPQVVLLDTGLDGSNCREHVRKACLDVSLDRIKSAFDGGNPCV
jgi:hypothetical protein